jgi:hypothetical protein
MEVTRGRGLPRSSSSSSGRSCVGELGPDLEETDGAEESRDKLGTDLGDIELDEYGS